MKLNKILYIILISVVHLITMFFSMFYFAGVGMAKFDFKEMTPMQEGLSEIAIVIFNVLRFPLGYIPAPALSLILIITNSILWGVGIVYLVTKIRNK